MISSITNDFKKERNIPPSFTMALETVRTRMQRNNLKSFHRGTTSPLFDIESAVVSTIIEMCGIRQCLTTTPSPQGIELFNSMIKETEAQKK